MSIEDEAKRDEYLGDLVKFVESHESAFSIPEQEALLAFFIGGAQVTRLLSSHQKHVQPIQEELEMIMRIVQLSLLSGGIYVTQSKTVSKVLDPERVEEFMKIASVKGEEMITEGDAFYEKSKEQKEDWGFS